MSNLNQIGDLLGAWAKDVPVAYRKAVYKGVKILFGLATLALLVLADLPSVGVNWSESTVAVTVLTGLLTLLGHLADSNTTTT